jgi:hypothetical protein
MTNIELGSPCLKEAVKRLRREDEDAIGFDVRLEDLSAYRAVNTKWYLVGYLNADAKRILPTTDESYFAQSATFYLVPGSADFQLSRYNQDKREAMHDYALLFAR